MKSKQFKSLRRMVIKYNKILIFIFAMFMLYALVHSVSILDCKGINYYSETGKLTEGMISCTNMNSKLLTFMRNYNVVICCVFLALALLFLILQKVQLLRINRLDNVELEEEKVGKTSQIILTLLLGYTGIHKYRTQNKIIGHIYLINFLIFGVTWIIKNFFETTYFNYLMFYCAYEFSLLFIIGIIILNIVEAIFQLASLKDDEDKIYA